MLEVRTRWGDGAAWSVPSGIVPVALDASGAAGDTLTTGPAFTWVECQIHGNANFLSYAVLPPVGVPYTATYGAVPTTRAPIRVPPGSRLSVKNTSPGQTTLTISVWPVAIASE